MNLKTIAFACLFVAPLALSQDADGPAELRAARAAYLHQTKTATDPIKLQYLRTLETLKKTVGARGDVQGAVAIQKEIDGLGIGQPNQPTLGAKETLSTLITSGTWQWYQSHDFSGKAYRVRFAQDGGVSIEPGKQFLAKWELKGSKQLRVYLQDSRYYEFDVDATKREGVNNLKESTMKEPKSIRLDSK